MKNKENRHRAQFLRMMEVCEAGNINLILTKSISRFARNTVDSVEMLRRIRGLNVEAYFQKENKIRRKSFVFKGYPPFFMPFFRIFDA